MDHARLPLGPQSLYSSNHTLNNDDTEKAFKRWTSYTTSSTISCITNRLADFLLYVTALKLSNIVSDKQKGSHKNGKRITPYNIIRPRLHKVHQTYNVTPVKAQRDSKSQLFSRFTYSHPEYSTTRYGLKHNTQQQQDSQYNKHTFTSSSKLKSHLFFANPSRLLYTSLISNNSKKFTSPTAHIPTTLSPPDSDIAQLWDLVRATIAQNPPSSTSTMTSQRATPPPFEHSLEGITPNRVEISIGYTDIEKKSNDLNLESRCLDETSNKVSTLTEAQKFANKLSGRPGKHQTDLMVQEFASHEGGNLKYTEPATPASVAPIAPAPAAPSMPKPGLEHVRVERVRDGGQPNLDAKEETSEKTFSLGLDLVELFHGVPVTYTTRSLPDFTLDDGYCFADFLHIIITTEDPDRAKMKRVRKELLCHVQKSIWQQLSIARFNKSEEKKKILDNTSYYGHIICGSVVEVWEIKPEPSPLYSPSKSKSTTSGRFKSAPKGLPFSPCEIRALGTLNLSQAADVVAFRNFNNAVIRWGQVKRYESHATNLWDLCWDPEANNKFPPPKTPSDIEKYWSS